MNFTQWSSRQTSRGVQCVIEMALRRRVSSRPPSEGFDPENPFKAKIGAGVGKN
jgi:hypothetical protein